MKNQTNMKNKTLIISAGTIAVCAIVLASGLAIADSNHNTTTDKPAVKGDAPVEAPQWLTDYTAAKAQALSETKALMLDFTGSDWCPWCVKLDREVFATEKFQDYARKNLVLVKVDFPRRRELAVAEREQNERLAARFGIQGFPTVLVLGPDEKLLGTLGYTPGGGDAFVGELRKVNSIIPRAR
jgi:thioredoxin-related protein